MVVSPAQPLQFPPVSAFSKVSVPCPLPLYFPFDFVDFVEPWTAVPSPHRFLIYGYGILAPLFLDVDTLPENCILFGTIVLSHRWKGFRTEGLEPDEIGFGSTTENASVRLVFLKRPLGAHFLIWVYDLTERLLWAWCVEVANVERSIS